MNLTLLWIALIVYFAGMLLIALWSARRKAASMEDMAVAIIDEIETPNYIGRRMTAAY